MTRKTTRINHFSNHGWTLVQKTKLYLPYFSIVVLILLARCYVLRMNLTFICIKLKNDKH
jgi:hypothetical protein